MTSYTVSNIHKGELLNLVGSKDALSWDSNGAERYVVEYSTDNFAHALGVTTTGSGIDSCELPAGSYAWRVRDAAGGSWVAGNDFVSDNAGSETPKMIAVPEANGNTDLFFASAVGVWQQGYAAQHTGTAGGWSGTGELVAIAGKGKIANLYCGSADATVLVMTDDANGDALFVDDIFSAFPDNSEAQARIAQIDEIRAGAGDDLVDMTSQRFAYIGNGVTLRGGDGNDVLWANTGDNRLFGDAGNDRIVGAAGNDLVAGGSGDDSMHGGGGSDIFAFCADWGKDTVEQLADGSVTLWFAAGDGAKWNAETLTYADGENSVTVSGVTADKVTLKFGDDGSAEFAALAAAGAFAAYTSAQIFEEPGKGVLAAAV